MIIDLERFVAQERPYWKRLETLLKKYANTSTPGSMTLAEARELHYLYQRASADLARIKTFSAEMKVRLYLESLVAQAYGEIHDIRGKRARFRPLHWFFRTFPQTFRRHVRAFGVATAIFVIGFMFGGFSVDLDPRAKEFLTPACFGHLLEDPGKRVEQEEKHWKSALKADHAVFSAVLMTHNTKISIVEMALGATYGVGTAIIVLYNGILLGMVFVDYVRAGCAAFVFGWLLPHGVVEIPATLIGAQAGFILALALIGWRSSEPLRARMRSVAPDLTTLIFGVAILLVWAGLVESFLSQYHKPIIPYSLKIAFGVVELIFLSMFLAFSGRKNEKEEEQARR